MKTAIYHTDNQAAPTQNLFVRDENGDGTVNLVNADSDKAELVIGKCVVSEDGKAGTCTLAPHPKPAAAEKPGKKHFDDKK